MLWSYLLAVLMFFVGHTLMTFGGGQILISLHCSLPLTKEIRAKSIISDEQYSTIKSKISRTIIIWLIILAAANIAIFNFCSGLTLIGAVAGEVVSFLTILGKSGCTPNNVSDYINAYYSEYGEGFKEHVINALSQQ